MRGPWLLVLAGGLAASRAAGLRIQPPSSNASSASASRGANETDCGCLIWKDVYALHNVTCGFGLERYTHEWGPIDNSKLLVDGNDSWVFTLNESARLVGICEHFYHRMNHNYAMNEHANYIDAGERGAKRVWCYVKDNDECNKTNSELVPWSDGVRLKLFSDKEVPSMRKLGMDAILNIAKSDTLDLHLLLEAGGYVNMPSDKWEIDNVTRANLEPYARMRLPVMLHPKGRKQAKLFVFGRKIVTFLPGWPWGAVPYNADFKPTEPPDCPEEDCLAYDDYNEFCVRCNDDDYFESPDFGDYSKYLWRNQET